MVSLRGLLLLCTNCEDDVRHHKQQQPPHRPPQQQQQQQLQPHDEKQQDNDSTNYEQLVYGLMVPKRNTNTVNSATTSSVAGMKENEQEETEQEEEEVVLAVRGDRSLSASLSFASRDLQASPPRRFPPSLRVIAGCLSPDMPAAALAAVAPAVAAQWDVQRESAFALPSVAAHTMALLQELGPSLWTLLAPPESNDTVKITPETTETTIAGCRQQKQRRWRRRVLSLVGHGAGANAVAGLAQCLLPFFTVRTTVALSPSPCLDAQSAARLHGRVHSLVFGSSLFSRLSAQSVRRLTRELAIFRQSVFRDRSQDLASVLKRTHETIATNQSLSLSLMPPASVSLSASSGVGTDQLQLADEELPALHLPGSVGHCFDQRGQWRAVQCSAPCASLRKIELHESLLEHHKPRSIMQILLETRAGELLWSFPVHWTLNYCIKIDCMLFNSILINNGCIGCTARTAPLSAPLWESFLAHEQCSLCGHDFEWSIGFHGDRDPRERHNCFHCGALVCSQCSQHEQPIPKLGMLYPRRLCDLCELRGDFASLS
jgi:hypothetical protein